MCSAHLDRTPFCCSINLGKMPKLPKVPLSRDSLVLELSQVARRQRRRKLYMEITYPRYPIYFGTIPTRSTCITVNELSKNMISSNGVQVQKEKYIHCRVPSFSLKLGPFTSLSCRGRQINVEIFNARPEPLSSSLKLLFPDVLVAVA